MPTSCVLRASERGFSRFLSTGESYCSRWRGAVRGRPEVLSACHQSGHLPVALILLRPSGVMHHTRTKSNPSLSPSPLLRSV